MWLPTGSVVDLRHYKTPAIDGDILFVHGEQDDITLLSDMIAWAKPQNIQSRFCQVPIISLQVI
jgi:pimeloyl-ACP methyl ester carboxylesterase